MKAAKTRKKQGGIPISKKRCNRALYDAKQQAQSEYIGDIDVNNDENKMFKMARAIKGTYKDVTNKCVRDDKGNLTLSDEGKLHAWRLLETLKF